MSHCRVLTCDREATKPFAYWPVCGDHFDALQSGEEYRTQGSEPSATGMSQPMLLMGEALRDMNEYLVVHPQAIELRHDSDCPEGTILSIRARRRGDADESNLALVMPSEFLPRLARMLRKYDTDR